MKMLSIRPSIDCNASYILLKYSVYVMLSDSDILGCSCDNIIVLFIRFFFAFHMIKQNLFLSYLQYQTNYVFFLDQDLLSQILDRTK